MLDLFEKYEQFIKAFHISCYELEGEIYRFKANLTFVDNSQLFIKEYLFENYDRKYAYHWTDDSGKLICRWDNANHWTHISTFPHHKHVGNQILDSTEISLDDVLAIICEQISNYTAE